ncbi:bile acid:sodium symporter family protein [Paenibacillus turpanensis]|uniref:bile acid:sodium symporter family protein n=1 Tax=Paenibacillus turpanensis TaxID=2689078 RepID=UPI0014082FD5|nr:bile acid:sodium symporter family protein [Paenibacillus turpanensis]
MLASVNRILEKAMPFMTPIGLVLGVIYADQLAPVTFLIPWLFAFMTFSGSLGFGLGQLGQAVLQPKPLLTVLIVLHAIMPLFAWALGSMLYPGDTNTITGLVLGMTIPTGVTSLIWVSIHKGNVPLTLTIILVDTLLSPFLVPAGIALFSGTSIHVDSFSLMKGLFFMVVLPSLVGMLLFHLSKGRSKTELAPKLAPFTKMFLAVVVAMNGAVVAPYLKQPDRDLVFLAAVVFVIAIVGYALGYFAARILRWNRDSTVTLTFNSGMRNISAGAVLATTFFPAAVAVPVILGMLFQQMLASLSGMFLAQQQRQKPAEGSLS